MSLLRTSPKKHHLHRKSKNSVHTEKVSRLAEEYDDNEPLEDRITADHLERLRSHFLLKSATELHHAEAYNGCSAVQTGLPKLYVRTNLALFALNLNFLYVWYNAGGFEAGGLTEKEFQKAVCDCLGSKCYMETAKSWFIRMKKTDSSKITWETVIDFYNSRLNAETPKEIKIVQDEYRCTRFSSKKKEILVAIISVPSPIFVYLFVGKYGNIGVYDAYFNQQKCYVIDLQSGIRGPRKKSRLGPGTVTDVVLMENSDFYVISTNNCCLHFVDVSASIHLESFVLTGLPYVPLCLSYSYNIQDPESTSYLFWGDIRGYVHLLEFVDPSCSMFELGQTEETQWLTLSKIEEHRNRVKYRMLATRHRQEIRQLSYVQYTDWLITCSSAPERSLVIENIFVETIPYVFKCRKGIECFDYSEEEQVLATGSKDGLVRLWTPTVPYPPRAVLSHHQLPVAFVRCLPRNNKLFSISKDAHLCIWNVVSFTLLQEVYIDIKLEKISVGKNAIQFVTLGFQSLIVVLSEYAVELLYTDPPRLDEERPSEGRREELDANEEIEQAVEKWNLKDDVENYLISLGCPYLALKLYPVDEISISSHINVRRKGV